jgi:hypothetical protein
MSNPDKEVVVLVKAKILAFLQTLKPGDRLDVLAEAAAETLSDSGTTLIQWAKVNELNPDLRVTVVTTLDVELGKEIADLAQAATHRHAEGLQDAKIVSCEVRQGQNVAAINTLMANLSKGG